MQKENIHEMFHGLHTAIVYSILTTHKLEQILVV